MSASITQHETNGTHSARTGCRKAHTQQRRLRKLRATVPDSTPSPHALKRAWQVILRFAGVGSPAIIFAWNTSKPAHTAQQTRTLHYLAPPAAQRTTQRTVLQTDGIRHKLHRQARSEVGSTIVMCCTSDQQPSNCVSRTRRHAVTNARLSHV